MPQVPLVLEESGWEELTLQDEAMLSPRSEFLVGRPKRSAKEGMRGRRGFPIPLGAEAWLGVQRTCDVVNVRELTERNLPNTSPATTFLSQVKKNL